MAQLTDQQRAELYRREEEGVAQGIFQQLAQVTKKRCFKACVTRPSNTLSKDEQKCLVNCVDRFFEARAIVSHTYLKIYESLVQQQNGSGGEDF